MQNVKETIEYVIDVFHGFGIKYMVPEDFRQAKHSQTPQNADRMQRFRRLIFDLILLNMTDFKLKLSDYDIQIKSADNMEQFILLYLVRINCELLTYLDESQVAFNFNNMRDMLLLVGWLMAISDVFQKYQDILVDAAVAEIEVIPTDLLNETVPYEQKKRQILDPNDEDHERFIESYNLLMNSFRKIQHLISRKNKKVAEFQSKLKIQGISIGMKDFLAMMHPDVLRSKAVDMQALSDRIESMGERMRNQQVFWGWLESTVEVDKKEYANESDYGFPDDVVNLNVTAKVHPIDFDLLEQNCNAIQEFYAEMADSIHSFNTFWAHTSKNMNKLFDAEQVQQLHETSHEIIEQIDERLPSVNQFISNHVETADNNNTMGRVHDFSVNALINATKSPTTITNQTEQLVSTTKVQQMLSNANSRRQTLEKELQAKINRVFDSISNVVTAYPNYS